MLKVVIRVGASSKIRLKHTDSYRAVTDKEFIRYIELDSDVSLGIIELDSGVSQERLESVESTISYVEGELRKKVYILSNDESISLDGVYHSLEELQEAIVEDTNYDVRTYLKHKESDNSSDSELQNTKVSLSDTLSSHVTNIDRQTEIVDEEEELIQVVSTYSNQESKAPCSDNEYAEEVEELNEKLENALSTIREKDNLYKQLIDLKTESDNEVIRLTVDVDSYKNRILELESNEYDLVIQKLNRELEEYKIKLISLNTLEEKIHELDSLCDDKEKTISNLKTKIEELENSDVSSELLADFKEKRSIYIELLDKSFEDLKGISKILSAKDVELKTIHEEFETYKNNGRELDSLLESSNKRESELQDKIKTLQLDSENEINRLKSDINSLSDRLTATSEELNKYREKSISSSTLQADNEVLHTKISLLESELNKTLSRVMERDSEIKRLSSLEREVITVGVDKVFDKINYTGKAKIINVFATGSYGVTSLSYSIANRLKGNVLFIDLDIVKPMADRFINRNPMLDIESSKVSLYRTGLGILFSQGFDKFRDNEEKLIVKLARRKESELSCINGLYAQIHLETIDGFSEFINHLGNKYDYIVCDSGKLGYSKLVDSLIKSLSDIAHRNCVVSVNDTHTIRGTSLILARNGIKNYDYLLNMSRNSIITEVSKKSIGNSNYYILPLSSNLLFTNKLPIEDEIVNGRLSGYLSKCGVEVNRGGI